MHNSFIFQDFEFSTQTLDKHLQYVSNRNVENQLCVVLVVRTHQFQEAKGPET
jgi:hypothetical protein